MLAEQTDFVIGVDTHRDQHSAAILASNGGLLDETSAAADQAGYTALLGWARRHAAARRLWAIEGTGSYGAGLALFLDQHGESVVEIGRRVRRSGPSRAKSDPLDAIEAAREALGQPRHAAPRAAGEREALRVLVNTREGAVSHVPPPSTSSARSSSPRPSRYGQSCAASASPSSLAAARSYDPALGSQAAAPARSRSDRRPGAAQASPPKHATSPLRSPSSSPRLSPPCSTSPASGRSALRAS